MAHDTKSGANVFCFNSTLNFKNDHVHCSRVIVLCLVIKGLRTDGLTDMVFIKKIILNKSCSVLNFISGG